MQKRRCSPAHLPAAAPERLDEPQLRLIIDQTVMNPTDVVLERMIE